MSHSNAPEAQATLDWGVASRALGGGKVSGDLFTVVQRQGRTLLAVVDGLGHGYGAQVAASTAVSTLERYVEESLPSLVRFCHEQLIPTRGVVMSLASIDLTADLMTWVGIGNVEVSLFRRNPDGLKSRDMLMQRGGVVGYNLPSIRPTTVAIGNQDILVFVTDGIRSDFHLAVRPFDSPQQIADRIMAAHGRDTDDALVLVAQYLRT